MFLPPDAVRDSFNRVAASPGFAAAPRLRKFLCFVVERTLDGRTEDLKETVVGVEVFGRDASYDPGIDPVVRITAGRVRERLEQYYQAEGKLDDIRIELPKGGYVPRFEQNHRLSALTDQPAAVIIAEQPALTFPYRRRAWYVAKLPSSESPAAQRSGLHRQGILGLPLLVPLSGTVRRRPRRYRRMGRWLRSGALCLAGLGPGGGGPTDICVKAVGTEAVRRLFETPESIQSRLVTRRAGKSPLSGRAKAFRRIAVGRS